MDKRHLLIMRLGWWTIMDNFPISSGCMLKIGTALLDHIIFSKLSDFIPTILQFIGLQPCQICANLYRPYIKTKRVGHHTKLHLATHTLFFCHHDKTRRFGKWTFSCTWTWGGYHDMAREWKRQILPCWITYLLRQSHHLQLWRW